MKNIKPLRYESQKACLLVLSSIANNNGRRLNQARYSRSNFGKDAQRRTELNKQRNNLMWIVTGYKPR